MNRDDVIATIRSARDELRGRYGVLSVRVFGSTARGVSGTGSDIDLAIEIGADHDPLALFGAAGLLGDCFGAPVDVVEFPPRDPELAARIDRDAVRAF
ncbi:MAG: nucleotidyltransferase domain-containing protein [Alphaproteobacteria bacterium]|nr:nucleotidyltransferase domain-containing protein [Alphaproteobacteria bacterium]